MTWPFFRRCVRIVGDAGHRAAAGEVAVRPGGVLPRALPDAADQVWPAPAAPAFPQDRLAGRHRAALLRAPGGQDAHRDAHQGHDPLRRGLSVAAVVGVLARVERGRPAGGLRLAADHVGARLAAAHAAVPLHVNAVINTLEPRLELD